MVYLPTTLGDFWEMSVHIPAPWSIWDHPWWISTFRRVEAPEKNRLLPEMGRKILRGAAAWGPLGPSGNSLCDVLRQQQTANAKESWPGKAACFGGPLFWICFGKGKYPSVGWYVVSKTCTSIICGFHHGLFYSSFWDESTIHFPAGVVRSSPWENSCFSQWNHNRRRRFSGWRRRRRRVMPSRSSGGVSHDTEKLLVNNGL